MTFADELRNGRVLETPKWKPTLEDRRDIKIILDALKREALESNKMGKSSVKKYLAYTGYDKDYWHLQSLEGNILESDFSSLKSYKEDYLIFLQSEISNGLKELGFTKITVQQETIQLYRQEPGFFRDWKIVKGRCAKTMVIEFFW